MIVIVFLYAVLATTFIFAKMALSYASPFFLLGFRFILAGGFLLGYQYLFNRKSFIIKKEDRLLFLQATLFQVYFAFVPEFWALQYVSALKTTILYSATPFISAILSFTLLKERLTMLQVLGIIIGLGGLIPVLLAQSSGLESTMELYAISSPEIVLGFAVFSAAYAWFLFSKLMGRGYSFLMINGSTMFAGGIMCMITSAVFEQSLNPVSAWGPFLGWLTLLILSANIIYYNLHGWLLKNYSITFISFCGFLCPGFATIYDWAFMSGTIGWETIASLVLITIGLFVFYKDEALRFKNSQVRVR